MINNITTNCSPANMDNVSIVDAPRSHILDSCSSEHRQRYQIEINHAAPFGQRIRSVCKK
jgi:hypothetical protein